MSFPQFDVAQAACQSSWIRAHSCRRFGGCAVRNLSQNQSASAGYSSGNDSSSLQLAESVAPEGLPPSAPLAVSLRRQPGQPPRLEASLASKYALELGGGFNAPTGNKNYITWGGQIHRRRRNQLLQALRPAGRVPVHRRQAARRLDRRNRRQRRARAHLVAHRSIRS